MKESLEITFLNLKFHTFATSKDYTEIITDKLFELGAVDYSASNDERTLIEELKSMNIDCLTLFFSSYDRETKIFLDSIRVEYPYLQLLVITLDKVRLADDIHGVTFSEFIKMRSTQVLREYVPVAIEASMSLQLAPCDIYILISGEKYLKLMNKSTEISQNELDKYYNKDKDYLFIKRADTGIFYETVVNAMVGSVRAGLTVDESSFASLLIKKMVPFSIALKIPQKIVAEVVDSHLDVYKEVSVITKAKDKCDSLSSEPTRLAHIALSSLISSVIVKNLDWGILSIHKKLIKCGLFCDFSLVATDAQIATSREVRTSSYKTHPLKSAEVLAEMSFIDNDIISMIEQHHEQGDGSGFPKGLLSHQISKMSCIFIISEFIAKRLVSREDLSVNLVANVLERIPPSNKKDNFEEIFNVLSNFFEFKP